MNSYSPDTKVLDLSSKSLSQLQKEVTELKNLKVLFLSNNNFKSIPQEINQLENLEFLGMKSCQLTRIDISALPKNLRWLTLTDNKITTIPQGINQLKKLEKLLLAGNQITSIPKEIVDCKDLALLRISANKLNESPFNLIKQLPKLAWYADSGNPFSLKRKNNKTIQKINWNKITIKSLIGESAQNKIYQASINGINKDIAIKIFGNQITSDGYPQDDLNISILAGKQPNVVETLFEVTDVPENKFAVVLKMVDKNFTNLGLPPSFDSCYRDVFKNKKFSLKYILTVLKDINQAYIHLHELGIMNGDLYAHNILSSKQGHSVIGDFGAASLYDKKIEPQRELIDVKAFGYLIDDLINNSLIEEIEIKNKLEEIKNLCLSNTIAERPTFKETSLLLSII